MLGHRNIRNEIGVAGEMEVKATIATTSNGATAKSTLLLSIASLFHSIRSMITVDSPLFQIECCVLFGFNRGIVRVVKSAYYNSYFVYKKSEL